MEVCLAQVSFLYANKVQIWSYEAFQANWIVQQPYGTPCSSNEFFTVVCSSSYHWNLGALNSPREFYSLSRSGEVLEGRGSRALPNPSLRSWGNFLFLERFYCSCFKCWGFSNKVFLKIKSLKKKKKKKFTEPPSHSYGYYVIARSFKACIRVVAPQGRVMTVRFL